MCLCVSVSWCCICIKVHKWIWWPLISPSCTALVVFAFASFLYVPSLFFVASHICFSHPLWFFGNTFFKFPSLPPTISSIYKLFSIFHFPFPYFESHPLVSLFPYLLSSLPSCLQPPYYPYRDRYCSVYGCWLTMLLWFADCILGLKSKPPLLQK